MVMKINFADNFDLYDIPSEEGNPYVADIRLKDSTSLSNEITLGTAVSKQLSFTIYNPPATVFDGQKVTLFKEDDQITEADIDLTEYGLTDEEVLEEVFEPLEDDSTAEIELTEEQKQAIIDQIEAEGTTDDFFVVGEDDEETGSTETIADEPTNDNYRDEGYTTETETVDDDEGIDNSLELGEFYITNIVQGDEYVSIQALDGFILMNDKYVPTNTTDTVENMYTDFINQLSQIGIDCNEEPEYPDMTITWNYDTTFREAAGYFAGLMGGYATFERDGSLDIRQYMKNDSVNIVDADIHEIRINTDGGIGIYMMRCDTDITALENWITTSGTQVGFSIDFVNPFMTQTQLDYIFETYYEYLEYTPARIVMDWYDNVRAGDLINVRGNWILITNQTIDFTSETTTIDSLGVTATLSDGQIENPLTRVMQRTQRVLKSAVETAEEIATGASTIARAVSQHFWSTEEPIYFLSTDTAIVSGKIYYKQIDGVWTTVIPQTGEEKPSEEGWYERTASGAFVTEATQEEFVENPSGKNSIWNSAGMLFRDGLKNLLAIVTGNTTGVAIYDGQGNDSTNVVASFTDNGAVVGKTEEGHIEISDNEFIMKDSKGGDSFKVTQDEDSASSETYTENVEAINSWEDFGSGPPGYIPEIMKDGYSYSLTNDYKSDISIGFTTTVYYGYYKSGAKVMSWKEYCSDTVTLTVGSSFSHDIYDDANNFMFTYGGSTSFDSTNLVATLTIDSYSLKPSEGWDRWWSYDGIRVTVQPIISYKTSLLMPVVTIGRYADTTTYPDTVFAIGKSKLTPGESTTNVFRVARDGETNIQGRVASHIDFTDNAGTSTFRTTTQSGSVSIRGGNNTDSYKTVSIMHSLSGYYPLALIEYSFSGSHATWLNVYIHRLVDVTKGSCTAQIAVRDLTDGNSYVTPSISTTVLWAKAS